MKKLIARIRTARTWQEQVDIADDRFPGTQFDSIFIAAHDAKKEGELRKVGNRDHTHKSLGEWLANVILAGDSKTLRKLALALDVWKWHRPKPDHELKTLCALAGMFPPGWRKTRLKRGKIVDAGAGRLVSMRDVKRNLKRNDPDFTEAKWESSRRRIQRYAKELGIQLDQSAGRPTR